MITSESLHLSLIPRLAALGDTPAWLPIVKDEILLSDGIRIVKKDYTDSMSPCSNQRSIGCFSDFTQKPTSKDTWQQTLLVNTDVSSQEIHSNLNI